VRLSVVVTVVDGGTALRRCLSALAEQVGVPELEVLVPLDDAISAEEATVASFDGVRRIPVATAGAEAATESGRHALYDRRRAAGVAHATGELVALIEDRVAPAPDWARTAVELHAAGDHAAVGGAVTAADRGAVHGAVYQCDYGRYAPPFDAGPSEYLSDVNVVYTRDALDETESLWADRFQETTVNWALRERGRSLHRSPRLVVELDRGRLRLGGLIGERIVWARVFAGTRVRSTGAGERLVLAVASPLLPLVLFARIARRELAAAGRRLRFLRSAPAIAVLLAAWSTGEFLGYVTGRG
jgi:hypothetical protein